MTQAFTAGACCFTNLYVGAPVSGQIVAGDADSKSGLAWLALQLRKVSSIRRLKREVHCKSTYLSLIAVICLIAILLRGGSSVLAQVNVARNGRARPCTLAVRWLSSK